MYYINPIPTASGAYTALQSSPATGLIAFPNNFFPEFYKEGKEAAGFVTIEHDGEKVTSCVWNEEAYQTYIASLPAPVAVAPTTEERLEALEALMLETIITEEAV